MSQVVCVLYLVLMVTANLHHTSSLETMGVEVNNIICNTTNGCNICNTTNGCNGTYLDLEQSSFKKKETQTSYDLDASINDGCALYLAESSVPNSGLGIYTAIELDEGDQIGDSDIVVPMIDMLGHEWWIMDEVSWDSDGISKELNFQSWYPTELFVPGFGAAINCHLGLVNVHHNKKPTFSSGGLHRNQDPGAGAFPNYYDQTVAASEHIEAGSELFMFYGNHYFLLRVDDYGVIPLEENFEEADVIVEKITHNKKLFDAGKTNITTVLEKTWNFIRKSVDNEWLLRALPEKLEDVEHAAKVGTARHSLPDFIRTPEWLADNGMCLDNIRVGKSTILQAGRGAFATRFIPRSSRIAPLPVLQFSRKHLTIHEIIENSDFENEGYYSDDVIGQQLLLNYCFGNKNSSVLLLPYGPTSNFINHNRDEPNAEIRWSDSHLHSSEWLSLSPEELVGKSFGMIMDLVALRDILPGEEVFIDYGNEWDEAWTSHVQNWASPDGATTYISSAVMNERSREILTQTEQEIDPYPNNLRTACYYTSKLEDEDYDYELTMIEEPLHSWNSERCLRPCDILDRYQNDEGEYMYTAEMLNYQQLSNTCQLSERIEYIISHIPRQSITFIDRPYTTDQHVPNAFRHEMGLPDGVFPSSWIR